MRILYDLSFIIFGMAYLPYMIITKRYRYGMTNRFGFLSRRFKSVISKKKVIWLHAVSVGEIKVASILAPLLRKTFPSHVLVFSTVTHTGNKVAKTIATGEEEVIYLPFDVSFIVDKVVRIVRPELFLCLETELWPNLINSLHRFGSKIILVNGRISNKSYSGYKKIRFITSRILPQFSLILMQSEQDRERILVLGAPKEKVFTPGNLKFDLSLSGFTDKRQETRERLNVSDDEILLIAGSTHRGEEEKIIECFSRLKKDYSSLKLLIAPRHIERIKEIEELLKARRLKSIRFSKPQTDCPKSVFILDTIGDLRTVYSAADIVFIGGSLVKKGGQNPIEPAALARPVIFGKDMSNFHDVARSFLENKACLEVSTQEELYIALRSLLDDQDKRSSLGINAKDTVVKNSGSSERAINLISSVFPN
ncbi:3-deoxy-D-manno-octulosonic acid transferase [Candidatus Omnitrophota bacterium]